MIKFFKQKIHKFIRRNFYAEIWNIGFIKAKQQDILKPEFSRLSIHWLPQQKPFHYLADPFFIKTREHILLFAEAFSYFNKKGQIKCLKLNPYNLHQEAEQTIISNNSHFSYPFIFKENKKYYMLPENSSAKELALYKSEQPLQGWQKDRIVISGQKIIDATLLYEDQTYWLFYTVKTTKNSANSELHLAYSDKLEASFTPHPQNPVKTDVTSARPAGKIFKLGNKLYRPAQDCSKSYGGALVINQITKLSKNSYKEKTINRLSPNSDSPYPDGIHTVNYAEGLFVIDGKKYQFYWNKIFINFYRKSRKLLNLGRK